METIDNIQQYQIYVDAIPVEGVPDCWEFVQEDGSKSFFPEFDFYVPLLLTRSYDIYEYVDVSQEEKEVDISRQEFNPYFIEFGFFDSIKRNKVNHGSDLTNPMIDFIRLRRTDVSTLTNAEIKEWYDEIGSNEFPWNKGTSLQTTADDIDKVNFVNTNIVSKANFLGIDINK